ncbi:Ribonuclease H-like domain containing protein [Trema orientale]|uniref:Ribonuclease H-like domain containing protein n=1 Tax=Trema orientale TaxID=63057 RepID=A0A2P5FTW0_TREOI|nr:Ribonuclease H-like domain containing protein [Trema orientale]
MKEELLSSGSTRPSLEYWLPPPEGWLKINSDACSREGGSVGAVLARDDTGNIVLAKSAFFHFEDPLVAESAAFLEGIRLAVDNGLNHVLFEVDCEAVALALKGAMEDVSWEAHSLLLDCRNLLRQITSWEIEWIPRVIKTGPHNLAIWCRNRRTSGLIQTACLPFSICNPELA